MAVYAELCVSCGPGKHRAGNYCGKRQASRYESGALLPQQMYAKKELPYAPSCPSRRTVGHLVFLLGNTVFGAKTAKYCVLLNSAAERADASPGNPTKSGQQPVAHRAYVLIWRISSGRLRRSLKTSSNSRVTFVQGHRVAEQQCQGGWGAGSACASVQ